MEKEELLLEIDLLHQNRELMGAEIERLSKGWIAAEESRQALKKAIEVLKKELRYLRGEPEPELDLYDAVARGMV